MNKKSLILTLILVFLSSCSLFQKDNQEQVSTLLDTQEQQEVIIQDEQELQNEEISQTGALEEDQKNNNSELQNEEDTQIVEEIQEELEIIEDQKQKNLSIKEQIINKFKEEQEKSKVIEDQKEDNKVVVSTGTINVPDNYSGNSRFFITDLQKSGENNYNIYFVQNSENKFIKKEVFDNVEVEGTFLLELETKRTDFEEVYYFSPNGNKIKGEKQGNKYVFEINDFFDLPSVYTSQKITFYNIVGEVGSDVIEPKEIIVDSIYEENYISFLGDEIFDKYGNYIEQDYLHIYKNLVIEKGIFACGGGDNIIKNLGNYATINSSAGCSGASTEKQTIISNIGEKIDNLSNYKVKNSINVGNIKFNLMPINFERMSYYGNVIYPERNKYFTINFNTFEEFENVNNISLEDILQKDFLINEMEGFTEKEVPFLPRYIYVNITKSPIIFRYEIDNGGLKPNFSVEKLTPDEEKLVQDNGDVMDLELTKKLIGDYLHHGDNGLSGFGLDEKDRKYHKKGVTIEITQKNLPIINLRKINDNGYYSMSFVAPYDFVPYKL